MKNKKNKKPLYISLPIIAVLLVISIILLQARTEELKNSQAEARQAEKRLGEILSAVFTLPPHNSIHSKKTAVPIPEASKSLMASPMPKRLATASIKPFSSVIVKGPSPKPTPTVRPSHTKRTAPRPKAARTP